MVSLVFTKACLEADGQKASKLAIDFGEEYRTRNVIVKVVLHITEEDTKGQSECVHDAVLHTFFNIFTISLVVARAIV
jgi:hypothetical protein